MGESNLTNSLSGPKSKLLSEIGPDSLLQIVPGLSDLIIEKGTLSLFSKGSKVCREGDPVSFLYIPLTDHLLLETVKIPDSREPPARRYFQKERGLGVKELLLGLPYSFTALAEEPTKVLTLPADEVLKLIRLRPDIERYLLLMTQCSGVRSFKRFLSEDRKLSPDECIAWISAIERDPIVLQVGDSLNSKVIEKGEVLFFVQSGEIRLEGFPPSDFEGSCSVGEGAWFGGRSWVAPFRFPYRGTASTPSVLFVLTRIADLPKLHERVRDSLYEEPWVPRTSEVTKSRATRKLSELPGSILQKIPDSFESLASVPLHTEDSESLSGALQALAILFSYNIHSAAILAELGLHSEITPLRVCEALEAQGFYSRNWGYPNEGLGSLQTGNLVHFGQRFWVFLEQTGKNSALLFFDPARGVISIPEKIFQEIWNKQAIEVREPDSRSIVTSDSEGNRRTLSFFRNSILAFPRLVGFITLLSLALVGLEALIPKFSQYLIDEILTLREWKTAITILSGSLLVVAFSLAATFVREFVISELSIRVDFTISSEFFRKFLGNSSRSFKSNRVGEILARFMEIDRLREFLSTDTLHRLIDALSVLVYSTILFFYGWQVALIPVVLVAFVSVTRWLNRGPLQRLYQELFQSSVRTESLTAEQISAIAVIKSTGTDKLMRDRWEDATLNSVRNERSLKIKQASMGAFLDFISSIANLLGIYWASKLVLEHKLTPGEMVSVCMYLQRLISPIHNLSGLFSEWEQLRVSLQRLTDVFSAPDEQNPERTKASHTIPLRGKIRLERINFRYREDSPWILKDISLAIYPNQVIAIVGESGCGKTTLANLISGLLPPTSGRILYDEADSQYLNLSAIRSQIGYVMQGAELFSGTFRENIAFGDDRVDVERMERASRLSNSDEFIHRFPRGFDHFLGEGGMGLSGGQKQRLCIARVLYRNPKILIMDEATSAMDTESELLITENIQKLLEGKTAIIIAHRFSTIRHADRILVMKDGRIVEDGTHSELIKTQGIYAELFEAQSMTEAIN